MPVTFFRRPRPADKGSVYIAGEQLRIAPGTGDLAGFSVTTVQSSAAARALTNDGTWKRYEGSPVDVPVEAPVVEAPVVVARPPAAPKPLTLAAMEAHLDRADTSHDEVDALEAAERAGKNRTGAFALLSAWREAHPVKPIPPVVEGGAPATVVLPADPAAPLDPGAPADDFASASSETEGQAEGGGEATDAPPADAPVVAPDGGTGTDDAPAQGEPPGDAGAGA